MGNMNTSDNKFRIKDILILILFLLLLAIPIYFAYTILFPKVEIFDQEEGQNIEQDIEQNDEEELEQEEEKYSGPHYEEIYETIEGENAYIAVPTRIDEEDAPRIIVYSHGSNTTVTSNTEDEFMQDLQKYGEFFTQHNFIFAASNQHGANWGSDEAIQDTVNMIDWIKERYDTRHRVNMVGYSMGGLPTMNFTSEYPELVNKIALLAPTTRPEEWDEERVEKIRDIDIKIWHGTADVNVGYSLSTTFVNKLASFDKDVTLVTLEGKTHWDIHTEYIENILEFFSE
jgi:dipeptidyl aminopeptidase/acylaminoacyl peptidase